MVVTLLAFKGVRAGEMALSVVSQKQNKGGCVSEHNTFNVFIIIFNNVYVYVWYVCICMYTWACVWGVCLYMGACL